MSNKGQKKRREPISDRRKFIFNMARGVGIATIGGFVWSAYIDESKGSKLLLRPPGAIAEEDFIKTCIKCGLCVEACPYDTLVLTKQGDHNFIGTPYFTPREIPCHMCKDIPCVPVCPSGALDLDSVVTENKLDINKADMGEAIIDEKRCIAFLGMQCDACYRSCPLIDSAIKLEAKENAKKGSYSFLQPVVYSDPCTGCGLCEHACILEKSAIEIFPRKSKKANKESEA